MKTQSDSLLTEPWLSWAIEIQSIAQNGLTYCKNIYDIERYERLRDLSAEMLAYKTAIPKETVKSFFCKDRKSTRLNSSHRSLSRMPSSA